MMKIIDMRTKFFFFSTLIIVALIPAAPKDFMDDADRFMVIK